MIFYKKNAEFDRKQQLYNEVFCQIPHFLLLINKKVRFYLVVVNKNLQLNALEPLQQALIITYDQDITSPAQSESESESTGELLFMSLYELNSIQIAKCI